MTQLFYDVELFLKFVSDCRALGITCPIIPGIMPIQTYAGFARMVGFCKTYVPPEIQSILEGVKDNDEACRAYGIQLGIDMCRRMLAAGTPGVHLYSLNQEKAALNHDVAVHFFFVFHQPGQFDCQIRTNLCVSRHFSFSFLLPLHSAGE